MLSYGVFYRNTYNCDLTVDDIVLEDFVDEDENFHRAIANSRGRYFLEINILKNEYQSKKN